MRHKRNYMFEFTSMLAFSGADLQTLIKMGSGVVLFEW
jgi:hypothetical protein